METVAVASVVSEGEEGVVVVEVGRARESLAQATAWLAPLPPGEVAKESAVRVSPGRGSGFCGLVYVLCVCERHASWVVGWLGWGKEG
jgi:hypothetical protein